MNRQERRASKKARQRRMTQVKTDMRLDAERRGCRYVIFLNGVPAWPDSFETEKKAHSTLRLIKDTMKVENPDDPRLDGFEVKPVLPSKAP